MKKSVFKKMAISVISLFCMSEVSAQWTTHEGIRVDNMGIGNGMHTFPWSFPGIVFGNNTGASPSGEAIGSKRNPGTYSHGLDFHTDYIRRMNITQSGLVNIGAVNVSFPNSDANLEIQSSSAPNTALRVYPIFGNFDKAVSITKTGPGAAGTNAGISFQNSPSLTETFELRATSNGIEIAEYGYPSGNISNSKFIKDAASGMILETPTVRLKGYTNGIGTNKYLTTDATGKVIFATLTGGGGVYTAGAGISIVSNVITNTNPSKWSANGTHIYNGNVGNVGVGISAPTAKLHTFTNNQTYGFKSENDNAGSAIACYGKANVVTGMGTGGIFEGSNTGVYGSAEGDLDLLTNGQTGRIYDFKGVWGYASDAGTSNSQFSIGVKGEGYSASNGYAIGLHGVASHSQNSSNEWAVYADGRTYTPGGVWTSSDTRLKTKINNIENALDLINKLEAKTYEFRKDGKFANTHLPKGNQYGFLAQDIEKVVPEIVTEAPIFFHNKENETSENYKAVNYTMLIPILTQAIKEQQAQIEELKNIISNHSIGNSPSSTQETEVSDLMKGITLSQNVPNPFSVDTRISYSIPQQFKTAKLGVYDLNGQELKLVNLTSASGDVIIQGGNLKPGMYLYTLIIDGRAAATKKMTLTSN